MKLDKEYIFVDEDDSVSIPCILVFDESEYKEYHDFTPCLVAIKNKKKPLQDIERDYWTGKELIEDYIDTDEHQSEFFQEQIEKYYDYTFFWCSEEELKEPLSTFSMDELISDLENEIE